MTEQLIEAVENLRRATMAEQEADKWHKERIAELKIAADQAKEATEAKTAAKHRVDALVQNLTHGMESLI